MTDDPSAHLNRYGQIIETIFLSRYTPGSTSVPFARDEFRQVAEQLNIDLPKNLGDVIYSFRFRVPLPASINQTAPAGQEWTIRLKGRGQYAFELIYPIRPNALLAETKIPDATPVIVAQYAFGDEQALLTRLRYNRLIDIFTGVTCYSMQNHLRTTVTGIGQVETDEIYVGVDRRGVQFVIPVQAKGGRDRLSAVQIEQDYALCREKFASLVCRPVGAQFIEDNLIALFEFIVGDEVRIVTERHYRLVESGDIDDFDLTRYQQRPLDE